MALKFKYGEANTKYDKPSDIKEINNLFSNTGILRVRNASMP